MENVQIFFRCFKIETSSVFVFPARLFYLSLTFLQKHLISLLWVDKSRHGKILTQVFVKYSYVCAKLDLLHHREHFNFSYFNIFPSKGRGGEGGVRGRSSHSTITLKHPQEIGNIKLFEPDGNIPGDTNIY